MFEPLDNVDPAVDNEDDTSQEDLGNLELESHTKIYNIEIINDDIDNITKASHLDCNFSGFLETVDVEIASEFARPGS